METNVMKKLLLLVASLSVMLANSAGATITVVNPPARAELPPPGSNVWDWTYQAVLTTQDMHPGDFFTIYDFPFADLNKIAFGKTSGDDKASFDISVQNTGATPPKTSPPDNPFVTNVTVTLLDGDTTQLGNQNLSPTAGGLQLGTLHILTNTSNIAQSNFGSVLQKDTPTPTSQIGPVEVAAIPEPGSITLLVAGLVACGALSFRRRGSVG
jgi:hypothetical protein